MAAEARQSKADCKARPTQPSQGKASQAAEPNQRFFDKMMDLSKGEEMGRTPVGRDLRGQGRRSREEEGKIPTRLVDPKGSADLTYFWPDWDTTVSIDFTLREWASGKGEAFR